MKKTLSIVLAVTMLLALLVVPGTFAASDTIYMADDFEDYEAREYGAEEVPSTANYAIWGNAESKIEVAANSIDETYGQSMHLTRTALYTAWDLDKLYHTKEDTVVIDMLLGFNELKTITVNGFFEATGGDERGENLNLLWLSNYNGRNIIKVGAAGVSTTKDLKKRVMNRLTLVLHMDDTKDVTADFYLDGEKVNEETASVGIRSKSLLRLAVDAFTAGSGTDAYLDNLVVAGLAGTVEEYLAQPFPGNTSTTTSPSTPAPDGEATPAPSGEATPAPTATAEPAPFEPVRDPNGNITVYIDEQPVEFDVPPALVNSRTMVPMRKIFEAIGAEIQWDEASSTVTGTKGDKLVRITIGEEKAAINGDIVMLDQPAILVDGRTLVPVRVVSEGLGLNVEWDEATLSVIISTK